MSSEPVFPLNNAEKEEESPYVAPGAERELRRAAASVAARTDRMLQPEYRDSRPLGQLPIPRPAQGGPESGTESTSRMRDTAHTVGSVVGKAVNTARNTARDLPRRLAEMKERFTVIKGRTQENAAGKAAEIGENAKEKVNQARTRIEHYAHNYPVQFILGVGGAAFVVGMVLRMWRSSRRG